MLEKAMALARANKLADAEAIYTKLLKEKPRNVAVLQATILFHNRYSRKYRAAVPLVQTLLRHKPKLAKAHAIAAETYCNCARPFMALPHADQAVALAPNDPDCLFVAAVTAMQINRFAQAMTYIETALAVRPDHVPSLLQKGRALRNTGHTVEAAAVARTLLEMNTDDLNALDLYFSTSKITADDTVFLDLKQRIVPACEKLGGGVLASVLQLQGKAQNDHGNYDAAFQSYARAKKARPVKHDSAGYAQFVSAQCSRISAADLDHPANETRQPLLIVGMPRSGSTLIEQILSGHSKIASAGESPSLNVIVQDTGVRRHNGADLAEAIKQIPADAVTRLGERYLRETAQSARPVYVIDKSLHNFELLGFFARLFPNAPIIHTTRDPLDTTVSCYMQPLSAWHSYTYDQTALGRYYLQYLRLMTHWKAVLPNPMMDVSYEDLVANTEGQTRRITDFLNLKWEPACLDFQISTNTSSTLSTWQVRQPINSNAIKRWKRYDTHIGPLKAALSSLYPDGLD